MELESDELETRDPWGEPSELPASVKPTGIQLSLTELFFITTLAAIAVGLYIYVSRWLVIGGCAALVVVQAIRHWFQTDPNAQTGWLGALQDPQVGRALALIHRDPTHPWTVETLAGAVGVSRSGLAARFVDLVGETPMTYLRQWRFEVAQNWLRDTDQTLAEIAEQLGYESEASFSRAFKKATGRTPGSVRREASGEKP